MEQHTPGPWWVGPHYKSDVESGEGRITECRPLQTPRAIANAHLIAAAPELLDALKPFAKQKCYGAESGYARACVNTPTCPTCAARAAIAKAEGK
jgi:hypothetical protein